MNQKGLFSLEAAVDTVQESQVRDLQEAPCAWGNYRQDWKGLRDSVL